jgi:hypothetical protein
MVISSAFYFELGSDKVLMGAILIIKIALYTLAIISYKFTRKVVMLFALACLCLFRSLNSITIKLASEIPKICIVKY